MTAVGYETRPEGWEEELPRRPRRQFFNRRTAALAALVTGALGFYGGVRVEKGQLASSTSASTGSSLPAGLRAGGGAPGAAGGTARAGATAGSAGRPGGGNVSFGTVKSIDGKTIYVSDSSGNTVKVTLSPVAKISKSLKVSKSSVRPGDAVVIQGVKSSQGTLTATSVSDSGASASSPAGGSTAGGSSRSGSSAVGSLFGSGG